MSFHEEIDKSTKTYIPAIVNGLIASNKRRYGAVNSQTKRIVFFMLKKIILRAVTKFESIESARGTVSNLMKDDIAMEMYELLERCINKFDPSQGTDFLYYYNNACNRRVERILEYKENTAVINFLDLQDNMSDSNKEEIGSDDAMDEMVGVDSMNTSTEDSVIEDLRAVGLNEDEITYIVATSQFDKKKDVVEYLGVSARVYRDRMKRIKQKIEESEIFRDRYES